MKFKLSKKYIYSFLFLLGLTLLFLITGNQVLADKVSNYDKSENDTLHAWEWNQLVEDFVRKNIIEGQQLSGYYSIGGLLNDQRLLRVHGNFEATSIYGSYQGNINATNVSSGLFGSNTGSGFYTFPSRLGLALDSDFSTESLYFYNTNVRINRPSANNLAIYTADTERLRINDIGYIGLGGITNPGTRLSFPSSTGNQIDLASGLIINLGSPSLDHHAVNLKYLEDNFANIENASKWTIKDGTDHIYRLEGNVGIGTDNPGSLLTIANNEWLSAIDSSDSGVVNMFRVNTNNQIEVGGPLLVGSFEFAPDSGLVTLADMPVTSASADGTPQGYALKIDRENILGIYAEADGSGGIKNKRVGIGTMFPSSKLTLVGGDLEMDHNKSIIINDSGQNTTLLLGNYADGHGFVYGNHRTASLAIEGDLKANRLCIKEDCKGDWDELVTAGMPMGTAGQLLVSTGNTNWTATSDIFLDIDGNVQIGSGSNLLDIHGNLRVGTQASRATIEYTTNTARTLTIPNVGGNRTFAFIDQEQTFSAAQTFSVSPLTLSANEAILSFSSVTGTKSITTGGTTHLNLNPGGNIGIKHASPGTRLTFEAATGNQIDVSGGRIIGLNLTPLHDSEAVPLKYLEDNFATPGDLLSSWSLDGNTLTNDNTWLGSISNHDISFRTNNTERLRILKDGNIGIGTSSPLGQIHIVGDSISYIDRYVSSWAASAGYQYRTARGSVASPSATQSGDMLGQLSFAGHTGSAFTTTRALLAGYAGQEFTSTNQGSGFQFWTTPLNSTSPTERMRLTPAGDLGIGNSNPLGRLQVSGGAAIFEGNVGIGTTSPNRPLDIVHTGANTNSLFIDAGGLTAGTAVTFGVRGPTGTTESAFGLFRGTQNFAYALFAGTTGGAGKPGFALGSGTGARDTLLYRDDVSLLRTNSNMVIDGTAGTSLAFGAATGNQIDVSGGRIIGLNITPAIDSEAVPLKYLEDNFAPLGASFSKWLDGDGDNIYRLTGNVGIGTDSPLKKLHITGDDVALDQSIRLGVRNDRFWDITMKKHQVDDYYHLEFELYNRGYPDFVIDGPTGNIGIGTNNIGSLLTIANNEWIGSVNADNTSFVNMFRVNTNNQIEVGGPLLIGSFEFAPDSGLVTLADMPVTSASAAGTPQGYALKIDGNNIIGVYSEADGTGGVQNRRVGINTMTPNILLSLDDSGLGFDRPAANTLAFFTNDSERMRINSGGNVGINNSDPGTRLSFGAATGNQIDVSGGRIMGLNLTPADDTEAVPLKYLDDNFQPKFIGGIPWSAMEGYDAGPPPSLTFEGDWWADAYFHNSDITLKNNILSLENNLNKIRQLNPVSFNWKNGSKQTNLGFIAQEVEKILPELVATNQKTGLKSIQYANFSAILVGAMQEQQKKIDQLEIQVEILRRQLESLTK